jgi:hypothetical protein
MIQGAELIEVETVVADENQTLTIQFSNGQKRKVDMSKLLENPPPVFLSLRDKNEFKKVSVNPVGGIQWECGADLSAEYLLSA